MKIIAYFSTLSLLFILGCSSSSKPKPGKLAKLYYQQGTSLLIQGNHAEGLKYLLKAYEMNPEDDETLANLGMAYYLNNDVENGKRLLVQSLKLNPENPNAKNNLATIYMNENNLGLAQKLYEELTKNLIYDNLHRTYYNLGLIEEKKNNLEAAKGHYLSSLAKSPDFCHSHFKLAQIIKLTNPQKSLRHLKNSILGECLNNPAHRLALAEQLAQMHYYEEAVISLNEILRRFPNTKESYASQKLLEYVYPKFQGEEQ